jgi:hypothetical protein
VCLDRGQIKYQPECHMKKVLIKRKELKIQGCLLDCLIPVAGACLGIGRKFVLGVSGARELLLRISHLYMYPERHFRRGFLRGWKPFKSPYELLRDRVSCLHLISP